MTQNEFETLTGGPVGVDEYARIEAVYMAAGELDKEAFCRGWVSATAEGRLIMEALSGEVSFAARMATEARAERRRAESELERAGEAYAELEERAAAEAERLMAQNAKTMAELSTAREENRELFEKLARAEETIGRFARMLLTFGYCSEVRKEIGPNRTIALKCEINMDLDDEEREFLAGLLGGGIGS